MFFYMPAKVYSEKNCVLNHAEELAALGTHALLVTGRSSAEKNGSLQDVIDALAKGGVKYTHFNEVEENPSTETVMKARDAGVNAGCDFVIGIGGGSPMDAAKAIALMIKNKDAQADYLFDAAKPTQAIPLALIPTTCGTGSESTPYSIITRHELKTKQALPHKVFAALSLIDGKYLATAPAHVLTDTTTDALAHFFESFVNVKATDYSKLCVEKGLEIWKRSQKLLQNLDTEKPTQEALFDMLNASMIAGMAISHTGTSLPHGLSYALTYNTGMPHGKACGYFMPGYLREADKDMASEVLRMAGFAGTDDLERHYEITCGRDTVDTAVLEMSVQDLLSNPAKLSQAPFKVDETVLRRVVGV